MARFYLNNEKTSYKLDPRKFYNCPTECSIKGFNLNRRDFCDGCDRKKPTDKLRAATLKEWTERIGIRARRYKYDEVLRLHHSIMNLESEPAENLTLRTSALLGVYLSEVNRRKRIELWDQEKESK